MASTKLIKRQVTTASTTLEEQVGDLTIKKLNKLYEAYVKNHNTTYKITGLSSPSGWVTYEYQFEDLNDIMDNVLEALEQIYKRKRGKKERLKIEIMIQDMKRVKSYLEEDREKQEKKYDKEYSV